MIPGPGPLGTTHMQQATHVRDSLSSDLASLRIHRGEPSGPRRAAWMRPLLIGVVVVVVLAGAGVLAWPYVEAHLFKTEVSVTRIALVSPVSSSTTLTASGY